MNSEPQSTVIFSPHPKQLEFIEAVFSDKYSFACYGGAMGGGKSYVGVAILIMLCKFYPNSKWCAIRESMPTLKRTTIETFKKVLPRNFLQQYNSTENIATFKNGSQIMFMAEDYAADKDFDRFKGLEVNGFLLEQIEELQKGLLDVCFIRAGRHNLPKMPKPIIMATVNPTQTWVRKKIYEPAMEGKLPDDWFYLKATIFDNPILCNDPSYMDRLKNLDDISYKRHIEGDWFAFAINNPFAYAFREQDTERQDGTILLSHIQSVIYDESDYVNLSFDFNVDPITCVAGQSMNIIQEFRLENSDIYQMCDRIKATFPNAVFIVTGDATGHNRSALTVGNINYYTVIKQKLNLADSQMKQPGRNMAPSDLRVLLNSILQNGEVKIDPDNCPFLIEDLRFVEVNESGDRSKSKENQHGHLLDCLLYYFEAFYKNFLKDVEVV